MQLDSSSGTVSLAPDSEFSQHVKTAISMSMVIDISTTCILEQPDFEYLEGVPNLQTHQKESKVTANSWRSDVRDSIFAVNNSILSYNDHFQSIYGFLSGFAKSMAKDADARQNLIEGLKDLKKVITIQKETAELVKKKMTDFLTNITTHKSHLNSDSTEIETRYEGDKGMIHDIQASIDAQDEAMNKDLTMMAAGSVGVVTGILTISFGVFMWIETAGGSTFVILAGIGITTGGAIAVGIGADDYNKKAHVKADLLKELAGIKTEITVAKLLRSGVQTLIQHIEVIVQVTDKLCEAWGQLDQDYGSLIETLNNTDAEAAAFVVQVNLDTAKKQWDRLAGDAELLKRNFLEPPKINVDSLKSAKPGLLIMPSMNVMSMYNTTEVSARVASGEPQVMKPLQPPAALTRNTHLKTWLDQTSQALLSFEHLLQSAKDSTSAPADVIAKNNKLMACGDVANKSAIVFLAAVEMLSESSDELERTAQLPDSVIAFIARTVFKKLSSQLSDTRHVGSTAVSDFSTMYEAQAETSVSINGWMVKMKNEKEADEKQMAEFEKQRDEAEQEKEKSKQDFWWCFLGPIACAAVAIEQSQKVNAANAKINALNGQLTETSKSLSKVIESYTSVSSLGVMITDLSHNIDGILRALQVIQVSVEGITASYDSTTPFIVRSHLTATAHELSGLDGSRLRATGRLMMLMTVAKAAEGDKLIHVRGGHRLLKGNLRDADTPSILDEMQRLTSYCMNIQSAAKLISSQPRLVYVENLLRQDQELTVGHSQEWLFGYSTKVISVLSRLNGLGVIFEFLDQPIRKRISVNEIAQAIEGLESVDADLHRFARYLYESKSVVRQFFLNAGDDNLRFISVNEILQDQLAGDKGKLKELEAQEATLSAELTAALEDVVNASTKLLIRDLEWGLVLAVSIGIGQIEFAAAEGAVLMNVFKEKANVAIKKVSSAGEKKAAGEILQLNESHDKISSIIEQRSQALSDIAKLSVDISVLRVLIQSVFAFNSNAQQLLRSLDAVGHFIETEIGNFYTVKLLLQAGKNDAALKRFDDAMAMWKSISAASDLLQRTFNYSF